MQGLWKDKRKHYLRDKGGAVYKKYCSSDIYDWKDSKVAPRDEIFYNDTKNCIEIENFTSKKIFKVHVTIGYKSYYCFMTQVFEAVKKDGRKLVYKNRFYEDSGSFSYDIDGNDIISTTKKCVSMCDKTFFWTENLKVTIHSKTFVKELVTSRKHTITHSYTENAYLYGKPFKWSDVRRYYSHSVRRKCAHDWFYSTTRNAVKQYIFNADWDKDVKSVNKGMYRWMID